MLIGHDISFSRAGTLINKGLLDYKQPSLGKITQPLVDELDYGQHTY